MSKSKQTGIALIAAERLRQINVERFTAQHDMEHGPGVLAAAAACYAVEGTDAKCIERGGIDPQDAWPWHAEWDKRKKHSDLRRLEIAGALIAAEIDRVLRQETKRAPEFDDEHLEKRHKSKSKTKKRHRITTEPFNLDPHNWFYVERDGFRLVHECYTANGQHIRTDQVVIPWRKLKAAIKARFGDSNAS